VTLAETHRGKIRKYKKKIVELAYCQSGTRRHKNPLGKALQKDKAKGR
tara:strand:- start:71 stop:214 length:144 start_codon:yes stop_codon:yes gene_type:complete